MLTESKKVLRSYGNMSSATVLYVLELYLKDDIAKKDDIGIIAAMGPGFCSEQLLVKWEVA